MGDSTEPEAKRVKLGGNLTLYHKTWWSSSRVALLVHELGIGDKVTISDIDEEKLKKDEDFVKRNPAKRLPFMDLGDEKQGMTESGAMIELLLELYDTEGKFSVPTPSVDDPESIQKRAQFLRFLHFGPSTAYHIIAPLFFKSQVEGEERDQKGIDEQVEKWKQVVVLQLANQLQASGGPYLLGEQFTAADICITYDLVTASFIRGVEGLMDDPTLAKYFQALSSREAYKLLFTHSPK
uniref:Glutathione transferase n=1 Tax=Compsopogon caeruleus TaxID=31354 RepID=A0A7S1XGB8_9RHOD|mmetsp:Transcript_8918/g.17965  ORF Transcript_8918/g.17965 Transcript_8918/m.17965 type:complete len:238 (+) Transcript_8918:46-759(+)|eukprot:CAMPEP_0184681842 /NCGR_PEP_ID=MMETSP0312-20130426/4834_1 /TAXON_ID=31354 /ORGANISM="Compsopogon coeruleus, Strain SAG 36.94" /LENGTH=237 /DNA_ID=CAMNT_0027132949 /DNA_START=47 /DNA_END=760 /DNA_ORIENTATION=+